MVINNFVNNLSENVVSASTFTNTDTPFIQVRYFNPIISPGSTVRIPYYVSDKYMTDKTAFELRDTFTTTIVIGNNTYTRTTYAGEFFLDVVFPSSIGETYFSIQCVDSNGVESAIQYFDVLIKSNTEENVYIMQESDLAEYGIVCDNDDSEVAYNNKAAISSLFQSVKANGYDKIIMLNRIYYFSYYSVGGNPFIIEPDDIACPNNFTIDLNGATFKAIPGEYIYGHIIKLVNNFDIHIINGNLVGAYKEFDFQGTKEHFPDNIPGEHIDNINVRGSKFCSFENLDISSSIGYDMYFDFNRYLGPTLVFDTHAYINYDGEIVSSDAMMCTSEYKVINQVNGEITIGDISAYSRYYGKQRELFISFYNSDKIFIKTVKTEQEWQVKIPTGAYYARVSAYGNEEELNMEYPFGLNQYTYNLSKGCKIEHCVIHDDRTIAIAPCRGNHMLYKDNIYYNIANEIGEWALTPVLGDYEDNTIFSRNFYFINNEFKYGNSDVFIIFFATNLNFIGNKNISFSIRGGLDGLYFANNNIPKIFIAYTGKYSSSSTHLQSRIFFKSCKIGNINIDATQLLEPTDLKIPMENCNLEVENTSRFLVMRDCKNGE